MVELFGKNGSTLLKWTHFSLIIMFEKKKNGASDQGGTICQNSSTVEPLSIIFQN